jgi:hypothetical protein
LSRLTQIAPPSTRFVSLGAGVRLGLPSHPASRRRSCLRLGVSTTSSSRGLSPPINRPCRAYSRRRLRGAYHHRTLRQAVRPEPRRCARPWRAVHGRVPVARPASPDRCAAAADAVDQSKRSTLSRPASIGSPMRVSVPSTPGRPRPEAFLPHRIDVRLWARPVIVTTKGATRCRLSRPNWLILSSDSNETRGDQWLRADLHDQRIAG